ncbi:MAG TPA: gliding motility-associated C-terminal domain-containing protein [Mucilaginibacter sp.]|nr:gliding motility-associated C-terminal domain-containing protein [Mucilaginibacter sp.]
MKPYYYLAIITFLLACTIAKAQQDVDFHLSNQFLTGKQVLKVKRDFHDPYLWVLAKNNEVYRINSITLAVDDYTPQFAAYNNLQFVDIAGRSQDTVFIATNSPNVIEYKSGAFKLIGPPDGLSGTINNVGMDHIYEKIIKNSSDPLDGLVLLMIATTANTFYYDCKNEKVFASGLSPGNNNLYELTYRSEAYNNPNFENGYDTAREVISDIHIPFTVYQGGLWDKTPEFGYHVNTAFYIDEADFPLQGPFDIVDYMNQLWGTETGLFQNNWNQSYLLTSAYKHYLNGIKVNKITSILGLLPFDGGSVQGLLRENLLIGTDSGFYFSNSGYKKYVFGPLNDYNTFTHDAEIGKKVINDICTNATSYLPAICENSVWVAAEDGLYLLTPDYGKYINNQQYKAASFLNLSNSITSLKICSGSTVTATVSTGYNGNYIQWYHNGQELTGKTSATLTVSQAGEYYAALYDPCSGLHIETNHLTVQVISSPVFTFNYPDKLQYCDSTSTTLKTDYNPAYHYRWYMNGVLNGDTSYNYRVTQSGKYKVEVSACTNSWIPSQEIEVDLIDLPVPQVTSDKSKYCAGDTAKLHVNIPTDPSYTVNWYKSGSLIAGSQNQTALSVTDNGTYSVILTSTIANCSKTSNTTQLSFTPSPAFTFNYPDKLVYCAGTPVTLQAIGSNTYHYRWYTNNTLNGDTTSTANITQSGKYKIEVSACEGSWIPSKEVQVDIINLPVLTIQTDKPSYCIGDNATLSIAASTNPNYTINWYKENVLLVGSTNHTSIKIDTNGNYSVTITSNEVNTDGSICIQASQAKNMVFNPPPTVSIQKIVTGTLCDGQTVTLQASYDNGTVKWTTGETSSQIMVNSSGTYTASVTSAAGCMADTSVDVNFLPNPVLNLPNVGVCVPSGKTATLTAPAGMVSYVWNGQPGDQAFIADHPQTITLTVTDTNGCQATQEIQVTDDCPNINIPNTFTPNGDGVNDIWEIKGLEYDATALVKIFTRNGQQIYQSRGYAIPWDGTYQDKKLPTGVYYYVITAKNGSQTYSGSVTILY